jgi:hypothetical protein
VPDCIQSGGPFVFTEVTRETNSQVSRSFSMSMIKSPQLMLAVVAASVAGGALASSHCKAPFISTHPSLDGSAMRRARRSA